MPRPPTLVDEWRGFLLESPAQRFCERFRWLLYPYALGLIWFEDWSFYLRMEEFLYAPPGLLEGLALPLPPRWGILLVQCVASLAAVGTFIPRLYRACAGLFFASFLLLDVWHNSFGFIDARIHLIWMSGLMVLCEPPGSSNPSAPGSSLAFRCMELVVVLVYVQSGLAKLVASGPAWALEGTTLQIAILRQGLPLGVWLTQFKPLMVAASCGTLALELLFPLYYPLPVLRPWLLASAIAFHLGTLVFMGIDFSHLWIFSAGVLLLDRRLLGASSSPPAAPPLAMATEPPGEPR